MFTGGFGGSSEGVDSVGKSINGVGVVEGLGTEGLEKGLSTFKGRAVIDVGVGLDNPDEFLAGVVEVELDSWGFWANLRLSSVSKKT